MPAVEAPAPLIPYDVALRKAHDAAYYTLVPLVGTAVALVLLVWMRNKQEDGESWMAARVVAPLPGWPDLEIPFAVGLALTLAGPLFCAVAGVWAVRRLRRQPERAPQALGIAAALSALATIPGLFVFLEARWAYGEPNMRSHGVNSLGPAPMCGGLHLLIAALLCWAALRYGPVLRAGPATE
jgi:hypothetical protein